LEEKVEKANTEIRDYFDISKNENDPKNREFKGGIITKEIKDLLEGLSFKNSLKKPAIELSDDELSEILKSLKLVNDSNKSGLGSLNKLYMAAEFLLLSQSKGRDLKLALIEELEAHLHPQAQLKVIEALQSNSTFQGQLILTTHSTTLASKILLENLILCNEDDVYPMHKGLTRLDERDYEYLERFLDSTKANMFFAKGVIMVEGDAENLLIPTIAEIIDKPLQDYGISVVNVGGTAFKRFARIFQRVDGKKLEIPVACITDLDIALITRDNSVVSRKEFHGGDKYEEAIPEEQRKKEKGIKSEFVNVFISPLWTLEYDILNSKKITREYLFSSILEAQLIKNQGHYNGLTDEDCEIKLKQAQTRIKTWEDEGKTKEWIACKIYSKYLDNNRVSKAVTAQRFASKLFHNREDIVTILKSADEFKYLREAIYHVTKSRE